MAKPSFAASALLLLLTACASSHTLIGQSRPPIDPSQVRIYFSAPPGGYEQIALLEASSGAFTYGERNKTDALFDKLRREAAKLGANGVLFRGSGDDYGNSNVGVGVGGAHFGGHTSTAVGVGFNVSPRQKYAHGVAVYVPNPPPPVADFPPPAEVPRD